MFETSAMRWQAIAESVRGYAHERTGLPNQDAFKLFPEQGAGPSLIAAVSDGHGSSECFRSDVGSALAVKVAVEALRPLLEPADDVPLTVLKHLVEQQLPRDIVNRWRNEVDRHLAGNPIEPATEARDATTAGEPDRYLPYGATMLAALVTDRYLVYLQLGDGDIVSVSEDGEPARIIPRDERLIANFTTSLCMTEAAREMRVRFQPVTGAFPSLVMLSTDGYSNSFLDEQSFLRVGPDILSAIADNGMESVGKILGSWLTEASRFGSGDDTTTAVLFRVKAVTAAGGTAAGGSAAGAGASDSLTQGLGSS